jgi:hypothetical protein
MPCAWSEAAQAEAHCCGILPCLPLSALTSSVCEDRRGAVRSCARWRRTSGGVAPALRAPKPASQVSWAAWAWAGDLRNTTWLCVHGNKIRSAQALYLQCTFLHTRRLLGTPDGSRTHMRSTWPVLCALMCASRVCGKAGWRLPAASQGLFASEPDSLVMKRLFRLRFSTPGAPQAYPGRGQSARLLPGSRAEAAWGTPGLRRDAGRPCARAAGPARSSLWLCAGVCNTCFRPNGPVGHGRPWTSP